MRTQEKTEFVIIQCPHCKAELQFKREPARRVHCMCKNCMKEIEVNIK